eukprot:4037822-Amphidinium_carterae.4
MIPVMPPPADAERSRSREGPRHSTQPGSAPTAATSPSSTAGYPSPASRPASVASTIDYPDQEAVPLPVHVPPADDDDDDDADDRAAATPSTLRTGNASAKRSSSAEDSPTKKSKNDDDNDVYFDDNDTYFDEKDKFFMSFDELYWIRRHALRNPHHRCQQDPSYWQRTTRLRQDMLNEHLRATMLGKDQWHWHQKKGWLSRIHRQARRSLFSPIGVASLPKEANLRGLPWRTTFMLDLNTSTYHCAANHCWLQSGRAQGSVDYTWTGLTVFSPQQLAFQPRQHYDQDFQHVDINDFFLTHSTSTTTSTRIDATCLDFTTETETSPQVHHDISTNELIQRQEEWIDDFNSS